ncbi:aminoglycoside phosphotransferase family protein, partial [Streptomyces sp. SID4946]|nr:aminoglycoside phosphotransferase family protein [Streptomyces sp. SID4946]
MLPALTAHIRAAGTPAGTPTAPATLADRPDATVLRLGDTVVKAHAPGTDPARLTRRLETAAALPGVLLAPAHHHRGRLHDRL